MEGRGTYYEAQMSTGANTPTESVAPIFEAPVSPSQNQRRRMPVYVEPPPIVVPGFAGIDITRNSWARLRLVDETEEGVGTKFRVETWGDNTNFRSATASWAEIPQHIGVQTGQFSTLDVRSHTTARPDSTQKIYFVDPFDAPPVVVLTINMIDCTQTEALRLYTSVTDITTESFVAHIDMKDRSQNCSVSLTWAAFPKGANSGVLAGSVSSPKGQGLARETATGRIQYPAGMFARYKPKVYLFLNSFEFFWNAHMTIKAFPTRVTARGFDWNVRVGNEEINSNCPAWGATYIVF